jgi:hypothetical protein
MPEQGTVQMTVKQFKESDLHRTGIKIRVAQFTVQQYTDSASRMVLPFKLISLYVSFSSSFNLLKSFISFS